MTTAAAIANVTAKMKTKIIDFDNDELYEVCCPECGDTVILDEYMLEEGSIDCPNCGSCLEFDFDDIELAAESEEAETKE